MSVNDQSGQGRFAITNLPHRAARKVPVSEPCEVARQSRVHDRISCVGPKSRTVGQGDDR